MHTETLGKKIKKARKVKKLNIIQLAYLASISPTTISMIERDLIQAPHKTTLKKLSQVLDKSFS